MIKSPVFWTLVSNNSRFWEKSAVSTLVDKFNANSGFIDQKSKGTINSLLSGSTDILQSGSFTSKKSVFLKSSTKNPVLNLDKPSVSWTCKVFVSSSNKLNEVTCSKVSILSSSLPISLMVYLTLSATLTNASSGS